MVIGSEKGYIYPYDIMTDPRSKKVRTLCLSELTYAFVANLRSSE